MGGRDHSYECETCGEMRGGFDDVLCLCGAAPLVALGQYVSPSRSEQLVATVPDPGTALLATSKGSHERAYDRGYLDATDAALAWLSGELPGDDENLAWCPEERRHDAWSWCLAHNLAVAGGMCVAWWLGDPEAVDWEPNTDGRPAPGWGGGE